SEYDVCENGCKMYTKSDRSTSCSACHTPRFKADGKTARKTMIQLSLKEQLRLLIRDEATRELLKYRAEYVSEEGLMKDFWDSAVYKILKPTFFTGEMDLGIAIFTDDFNPFRRSQHSMTIVHVIVYNF
ncbi:hypothetical protein BDB00DRAFT_741979, partial [Zychaea mexicana]|uniref:uncharacterized protein n=1 Tax=Zychaea mexicana TaxID=64656 RepID=UPI0022FE1BD5